MSSVHKGRKECGRERMLRARKTRPPPRKVPSNIVQEPFTEPGFHEPARETRRARRLRTAWDNDGKTGDIITWNRATCMSNLHRLARKSGSHVHDGPARHDVRPIESGETRPQRVHEHPPPDGNWKASTVHRTEKAAFSKRLHRERHPE